MREIKFRNWDGEKMCQVLSLQFWGTNDGIKHVTTDSDRPTNNVVMQYTGRKDKNGVEIYEGDLIQCTYCKKESGEVYWNESMTDFRIRWSDDCCGNARLNRIDNWALVVGNIYQNKTDYASKR